MRRLELLVRRRGRRGRLPYLLWCKKNWRPRFRQNRNRATLAYFPIILVGKYVNCLSGSLIYCNFAQGDFKRSSDVQSHLKDHSTIERKYTNLKKSYPLRPIYKNGLDHWRIPIPQSLLPSSPTFFARLANIYGLLASAANSTTAERRGGGGETAGPLIKPLSRPRSGSAAHTGGEGETATATARVPGKRGKEETFFTFRRGKGGAKGANWSNSTILQSTLELAPRSSPTTRAFP